MGPPPRRKPPPPRRRSRLAKHPPRRRLLPRRRVQPRKSLQRKRNPLRRSLRSSKRFVPLGDCQYVLFVPIAENRCCCHPYTTRISLVNDEEFVSTYYN